jgi:phosphatidate cytidylyltransferase
MKTRIISALAILAATIPIIIIGSNVFYLAITILALFALKEILDIRKGERDIPFIMKMISYLLLLTLVLNNYTNVGFVYNIDYRIISLLFIFLFIPLILYSNHKTYSINDAFFLIASIFFLGIAFNLLIAIRNFSLLYFVFLILITTATDTFAYITGYFIGKNKLAPKISPKKTWEGLIGGTLFGTFISCIYYYDVINSSVNIINLISIVALLSITGQIGDLIFSFIKRYYKKKDFSGIIPGHGGILDRLDSIIFVVLIFTLFITII